DDDLEPGEIEAGGQRGRAELLIQRALAIYAQRAAEAARGLGRRLVVDLGLDALLELIRELCARGIEELDAVVVVEIVRSADDDAEVRLETRRHVRDAGRRQRADEQHVDTGRNE